MAYAIGSGISAIGALLAMPESGVHPGAGFDVLLFSFIATIIGRNSIFWTAISGLMIGLVMNIGIWRLPSEYQTLIVFILMAIYLLIGPKIFETKQ